MFTYVIGNEEFVFQTLQQAIDDVQEGYRLGRVDRYMTVDIRDAAGAWAATVQPVTGSGNVRQVAVVRAYAYR